MIEVIINYELVGMCLKTVNWGVAHVAIVKGCHALTMYWHPLRSGQSSFQWISSSRIGEKKKDKNKLVSRVEGGHQLNHRDPRWREESGKGWTPKWLDSLEWSEFSGCREQQRTLCVPERQRDKIAQTGKNSPRNLTSKQSKKLDNNSLLDWNTKAGSILETKPEIKLMKHL